MKRADARGEEELARPGGRHHPQKAGCEPREPCPLTRRAGNHGGQSSMITYDIPSNDIKPRT